MRNRFHLPGPYVSGETLELSGSEFHHAVKVARVQIGERVEIFDGNGVAAGATVESIHSVKAVLAVTGENVPSREAPFRIVLAMSLIHLERFELVLQKGTELGAARFIPLLADRSEIRPERIKGRKDRWNRILFEAVKQSGRSIVPELSEPQTVSDVLNLDGLHVMFEAEQPASGHLHGAAGATLLIGPEGGWSDRELAIARDRGVIFRQLGPRRLRAETAAIVAMAVIGGELGNVAH